MDTLIWSEVREYLEARLAAARSVTETATDPPTLYRAQGDVRTLKSLLELPALLASRRADRKS